MMLARSARSPLFSILVPVYNVRAYLSQCLDSVDAQTWRDFELVLVDDGSTDGSGVACDEFAAERPHVRVIHQANAGLLLARRVALRAARGEYVVTLDSDDLLRADALEVLADRIDRWHPDVIAFDYSRSASFKPYGPSALGIEPGFYEGSRYVELERIICRGRHNNLWSKCYRRAVADVDHDYSSLRGLTHAEDLLQLCPVVDAGRSFAYVNQPLYYYRPNPASATKSYKPRQLDDLEAALGALLACAGRWGQDCPELARKGALLQLSYLLHMLVQDHMPDAERRGQFARICAYGRSAGLFGPWQRKLRWDKRQEADAMASSDYGRAYRLVRAFEGLKRVRDALASA